ncbi:MAG: AAA family ATPase [Acidobacteriota bacterium]
MKKATPKNGRSAQELGGITRISVAGYKSIAKEQSIEIRPLTILAGANSSGKSSIMQPLLLLKQTLESSYDPGPLLLNGPHVNFTSVEQILAQLTDRKSSANLKIGIETGRGSFVAVYRKQRTKGLGVSEVTYLSEGEKISLSQGMSKDEILDAFPKAYSKALKQSLSSSDTSGSGRLVVERDRCFLILGIRGKLNIQGLTHFETSEDAVVKSVWFSPWFSGDVQAVVTTTLRQVIHLPGLRGNPERTYPLTAVGETFLGTFENYTASVVAKWQTEKEYNKLDTLSRNLETLGLTWKVIAKPLNDTQVEIQVGRLARAGKAGLKDFVSLADVGVGVSQTLPVLVALQVAQPGQLVYLEQPEIHLHPRAQTAMAQVLADAAMRGVRVVAETHSSLLLLGIQTLVAEGKLPSDLVKLHWFTRGDDGATTIRSADLDETGAFGDWPEDFADVELAAESRYLDAAEARQQVH